MKFSCVPRIQVKNLKKKLKHKFYIKKITFLTFQDIKCTISKIIFFIFDFLTCTLRAQVRIYFFIFFNMKLLMLCYFIIRHLLLICSVKIRETCGGSSVRLTIVAVVHNYPRRGKQLLSQIIGPTDTVALQRSSQYVRQMDCVRKNGKMGDEIVP